MDAGQMFSTGPSRVLLTASAFRLSGTEQMMRLLFIICRMLIEIARVGTASSDGNHSSPSCCLRHASSSATTMYGSSVSKSAGGSLNARWPFSPMPTSATSIGCRVMSAPRRLHSAPGSAAPPLTKTASFRPDTCWTKRSSRYVRKPAGWSSGSPIYSSRWNILTRAQSTSGSATSAARTWNWLAPVARMIFTSLCRLSAARIASAARSPAAAPS